MHLNFFEKLKTFFLMQFIRCLVVISMAKSSVINLIRRIKHRKAPELSENASDGFPSYFDTFSTASNGSIRHVDVESFRRFLMSETYRTLTENKIIPLEVAVNLEKTLEYATKLAKDKEVVTLAANAKQNGLS